MSEQITTHVAPGETQSLSIYALDKLDANNVCHAFEISNFKGKLNPYYKDKDIYAQDWLRLIFQSGPVDSVYGMNGVTIESLLAVCKHRLEGFQSGPLACTENQTALDSIDIALNALRQRTIKRIAQNVAGQDINHNSKINVKTEYFPVMTPKITAGYNAILSKYEVQSGYVDDKAGVVTLFREGTITKYYRAVVEEANSYLKENGFDVVPINFEELPINHDSVHTTSMITVCIATRYGISGENAELYLRLERLHALPIDTVYDPTLHVVFGRARGTILETKVGVEARRKFLTDLGVDVDKYPELKLTGNVIID